jgi:hypothetical protein
MKKNLIFYTIFCFVVLIITIILFSKFIKKEACYPLNKYIIREDSILSDIYYIDKKLYTYTISNDNTILFLCNNFRWFIINKGFRILDIRDDMKKNMKRYSSGIDEILTFENLFFVLVFNKKNRKILRILDLRYLRSL